MKYTDEILSEMAKEFLTRNAFKKAHPSAYVAMSVAGTLDKHLAHCVRDKIGPKFVHTLEDLTAAFKRNSSLNAVKRGLDSRFYRTALERYGVDSPEWKAMTAHMSPHGYGGPNHVIYAIEFSDRCAYVGQTLDPSRRFKDHILEKGPVSGHILSHPGVTHEIKLLETNLHAKAAQEREAYWQRSYKTAGWVPLWTARAGGLGRFTSTTKEEAHQVALLCKTRNEFWTRFQTIAKLARRRGWFDEITAHLPDLAPTSEETRQRQSEAALARPQKSPEHMAKMSEASVASFAKKREFKVPPYQTTLQRFSR